MPHGRHLCLSALRLRAPAAPGHAADQRGGEGRVRVPQGARGPRHRAGQQAPGLQPAGHGEGHGAGEPGFRVCRGREGLHGGGADLEGPGRGVCEAADEQPGQDGLAAVLRLQRDCPVAGGLPHQPGEWRVD